MNSTKDIQKLLMEQMEDIAKGKGDLDKARVVADLGSQAIYAVRVELENKRLELDLAKSNKEVKDFMQRDFSNIQDIKVGK